MGTAHSVDPAVTASSATCTRPLAGSASRHVMVFGACAHLAVGRQLQCYGNYEWVA